MTRRTEGNAELLEASVERLAELLAENDNDILKLLDTLDSPLDEETINLFVPGESFLLMLFANIDTGSVPGMTVLSPNQDFTYVLTTMAVRAFLHGYIAAKMEAGDL
jgi:hypothetical protein